MQNNSSERRESFVLHCLINYLKRNLVNKATIKENQNQLNSKEYNVKAKHIYLEKIKVLQGIGVVKLIVLRRKKM